MKLLGASITQTGGMPPQDPKTPRFDAHNGVGDGAETPYQAWPHSPSPRRPENKPNLPKFPPKKSQWWDVFPPEVMRWEWGKKGKAFLSFIIHFKLKMASGG